MNETMKLLLSLSLSGSILAIIIFTIKPLIKHKLAKSVQYYIWLVVLLRLVLPFSFEGSVMNEIFYSNLKPVTIISPGEEKPTGAVGENAGLSYILPDVQDNLSNGVYAGDTDHRRYFGDLFNQYALYLWLLGVLIIFATNLAGYIRFAKQVKFTNYPGTDEENRILRSLVKEKRGVRLMRNSFVATPMLMGILRPTIIIPDIDFNEKQIKNILLHELTHLSRFDIGVKWLTMIAVSVHWFNPLMYFVKKEINRACELSCDEAVIQNLNAAEKQAYGDTLISVIAEHKYPVGVLQVTMCEEKTTLKERLVAIMTHNKKSKFITLMSLVILGAVIISAVVLGAGVGKTQHDFVYKNDTYGFTLTLPKDFAKDAEIKEENKVVYFVNKEIQKTITDQIFGVVARIEVYDKKEFTRENLKQHEDAYGLKYLGENENYYFGWAHASDVQIPPNRPELSRKYRMMEKEFDDIIKTFTISTGSGPGLTQIANRERPVEPPAIIITDASNEPIDNYIAIKTCWDGKMYDRPSFYQTTWDNESALLTGLHRPKPGEKFKLDFGAFSPDQIFVQMAYLTESTDESLLPIVDVPVSGEEGIYEFINPPSSTSDIYTSGRCYSITATWGDNSCEFVFATDGQFDNLNT